MITQSEKNTSVNLALFDFDGTLTTRDSFICFLQFTHGLFYFYLAFFCLLPILISYKLKVLRNDMAKEYVLKFFYRGWKKERLEAAGEAWVRSKLSSILIEDGIKKLEEHRENGDEVWLVTASCRPWIEPWCSAINLNFICTEMEYVDGKATGRLLHGNNYGPEKEKRIRMSIDLSRFTSIYAYGDSSGDTEMLNLSTHPHYKPFQR